MQLLLMPIFQCLQLIELLLILVLGAVVSSRDCQDDNGGSEGGCAEMINSDSCRLFMAESTIPNAGAGIFTAVPLKEGEQVGFPDLTVPTVDIDWHNDGSKFDRDFNWPNINYDWEPLDIAVGVDKEADGVDIFSPGLGSMANSHLGLYNLDASWTQYSLDGLDRQKDPGAGGFTGYHGRTFTVTKDLGEGSEIFLNYGNAWFKERENKFGFLAPFRDSYIKAESFMERYQNLMKANSLSSINLKRDLWEMIIQSPYKSRPLAALPSSSDAADRATQVGLKKAELEGSMRSINWLRENGKCVDNIKPGKSTIPQAGKGAFATRFIPEGEIVAPAPLIHIPYKDNLLMYGAKSGPVHELTKTRNVTDIIGQQLLLNYCFGHKQSTLLLCPYSGGVPHINHDHHSPNAKIVWPDASHSIVHNSTWLNQSVSFLDENYYSPGLEFDYVAIRDIQPEEEILIDYGEEWEEAWSKHVNEWHPEKSTDEYHDASLLNCFGDVDCKRTPRIRTYIEQLPRPYSKNLDIYCFFNETDAREDMDEIFWEAESDDWRVNKDDSMKYRCDILERRLVNKDTYLYEVEVVLPIDDDGDPDDKDDKEKFDYVLLKDVPQYGIQFVNKPYSSDLFLRNAFRHQMGIPDDMMPEAWKNAKS